MRVQDSKDKEKLSVTDIITFESSDHDGKTVYEVDCEHEQDSSGKEMFVTFSRKKLKFDDIDAVHLVMNDVTSLIKLRIAKERATHLKTLQSSVSHNLRSPI